MSIIGVFGASSTWGAWDVEKGGWVNRLRLWIDEQNLASDRKDFYWETYNLGVSGDTSQDLLDRFENEARAREARIIIISIGENDTVYDRRMDEPRITEDQFAANMEEIITLALAMTNSVMILGIKKVTEKEVQPVPWKASVNYSNTLLKTYDERLKGISDKKGVDYLPLFDMLRNEDLADGLHPNEVGHEKIFLLIRDFLRHKKWLG